jgi:hypothetical protein
MRGGCYLDLNMQAFRLVQEATSEVSSETRRKRAASRRGGLAGGKGRAKVLSPEERVTIAQKASRTRWAAKRNLAVTG